MKCNQTTWTITTSSGGVRGFTLARTPNRCVDWQRICRANHVKHSFSRRLGFHSCAPGFIRVSGRRYKPEDALSWANSVVAAGTQSDLWLGSVELIVITLTKETC